MSSPVIHRYPLPSGVSPAAAGPGPPHPPPAPAPHPPPWPPPARRAGRGYVQHIGVLPAPTPGAPSPRQATPAGPPTLRAATHLRVQASLLAFVLRRGRHG